MLAQHRQSCLYLTPAGVGQAVDLVSGPFDTLHRLTDPDAMRADVLEASQLPLLQAVALRVQPRKREQDLELHSSCLGNESFSGTDDIHPFRRTD